MIELYPSRWEKHYGSVPSDTWIETIAKYSVTKEQFSKGILALDMERPKYIPSPYDFLDLCGIPRHFNRAGAHKIFEPEPEDDVEAAPDGSPLLEDDNSPANKRKRAWAARDAAMAEINPALAKPYVNPHSRVSKVKAKAKSSGLSAKFMTLQEQCDIADAKRRAEASEAQAPESQAPLESGRGSTQSDNAPSTQPPASAALDEQSF